MQFLVNYSYGVALIAYRSQYTLSKIIEINSN